MTPDGRDIETRSPTDGAIRWLAIAGMGLVLVYLLWMATGGATEPEAVGAPSAARPALTLSMVLITLFVMIGPLRAAIPFALHTGDMPLPEARMLAARAVGLATLTGVIAGLLGQRMLHAWSISVPALHIATGLVLLLVALRSLLVRAASDIPDTQGRPLTPWQLAYPAVLSPTGISALILFLALTTGATQDLLVVLLFLAIMAMDLGAMWFARSILRRGGTFLAMLGALASVLQIALAIQILLDAAGSLGVAM